MVSKHSTLTQQSEAESGDRNDDIGVSIDRNLPSPNFFIVGAAKAGTTSLHAYLSSHPQVFMSAVKEPHYFAPFEPSAEFDNFIPAVSDPKAYQMLFAGSQSYRAIGEASPSYLCNADAAKRIKSAIPDAKIIISLRNPVQRAYSHYLMEYHAGRESLAFDAAIDADQSRKTKGWGISFQYLELSSYAEQVERFIAEFGRDKVLVVLFENLVRDRAQTMREIADFLKIDAEGFPESAFDKVHFPFESSPWTVGAEVAQKSSRPRLVKAHLPAETASSCTGSNPVSQEHQAGHARGCSIQTFPAL